MECREIDLVAYLKGDLSPGETRKILDHLDECPDCRERLEIMVALDVASNDRPRILSGNNLLIAAGLFLALLATLLYPFYFQPLDLASVATNESYLEFPLEVRDGSSAPSVKAALTLYQAGRYEEAASQFSQLSALSPHLALYARVSHYLSGHYSEAIQHLEQASSESMHRDPARWYLANTYLRLDNPEVAEKILFTLIEDGSRFQEEARRLLGQVRSIVGKEKVR
ncbi:MAG TPA: tetratricopeptide repeat protein [Acidobacteriota bacterium]|nr:tetratricopeptide repeat protein [Acidobacteriota bacterium]